MFDAVQQAALFDAGPAGSSPPLRVPLTVHQVAAAFGVHPATVSRWPLVHREQRGRETLVDLVEVVEFRLGEPGGLDLTAERARLARVQAERQELALQRERGELLEADDVQRVWEQYISSARARLLALPDTAAPRVVGLDVRTAAATLRDLVFGALEELARYNPDDHAGDLPASTQPDQFDPEPPKRLRKRRRKRRPVDDAGITLDDGDHDGPTSA